MWFSRWRMRTELTGWIVGGVFALVACKDRAEPAYKACLDDEAKDVVMATEECGEAVATDPNSTSGKAAAAKLKTLAPAAEKAKADKARADAVATRAAAQARAERLPMLRAKASIVEDGE